MYEFENDRGQISVKSTVDSIVASSVFHMLDFWRIYSTLQFLTSRYADQAFNEVGRYAAKPAVDSDHYSKTSAPIMLGSALATLVLKSMNAWYQQKKDSYLAAQDYAYALFSSSIIFFAGDLFSATGYMPPLSAIQFAMISLVGVLAMMAIFLKIATPLSSDKMIFSVNPSTQLSYFDDYAKSFPNPSRTERLLNAVGSVGHIASLSTFFWVFNHEMHNGVSPLADWQKAVLVCSAFGLAIFGARTVTDHPRSYLSFLMMVVFLNASAMAYTSVSSLACYLNCEKHDDAAVVGAGIFAALLTGFFSATHIEYSTEAKHVSNQYVEGMAGKISDKVVGLFGRCCGEADRVGVVQEEELLEVVSRS